MPPGTDPAVAEAQWLMAELGLTGELEVEPGARSLTDARLVGAAAVLSLLAGVVVDGPGLLAQRGLRPEGRVSARGASRLLPTTDGWLVVTLPRPDDIELVPAWLQGDDDSWEAVARAAASGSAADLAARGQELGLAVGSVPAPGAALDEQLLTRDPLRPWILTRFDGPRSGSFRVVDLSALWAGPLCAQLLRQAGADVVTVESPSRLDRGDPELHALLHKGCTPMQLDLRSSELRRMLDEADVVITSARPRALRQLDLWPAPRPGQTWVAITGYGLTGPWCDRVAYGDDAAAAGGLVAAGPAFFADAAADPLTGLYAAIASLACLRTGGGLVDIALREVARHVARPS
jgi:hypothetical protein